MIRFTFAALLFMQAAMISITHADQFGFNCDAALIETRQFKNEQFAGRLAYLQLINKENYEEVKRNTNATAFISYGFFEGNYDEFQARRVKFLSLTELNLTVDQSRTFIQTGLSADAAKAYTTCMEIKARGLAGIHIWTKDVLPDKFTLVVYWRPGPGDREATLGLRAIGGEIEGEIEGEIGGEIQTTWKTEDTKSYIVKRLKGKDATVTANMSLVGDAGGGFTDSLSVTARLIYERSKEEWLSPMFRTQAPGSRNLEERHCVANPTDWLFDHESARYVYVDNHDSLTYTGAGENIAYLIQPPSGSKICLYHHARGVDRNSLATLDSKIGAYLHRIRMETPDTMGIVEGKKNQQVNWGSPFRMDELNK